MSKESRYYDTFITNPGSFADRIRRATNLSGPDELLGAMENKPRKQAVDVLVETLCNQRCKPCFFQENGSGSNQWETKTVEEMVETLMTDDPEMFMLYPREITLAKDLLSLYSKYGWDRIFTNAKWLHKEGMVEELKKAGIKRMSVTVPGAREAYSIYTGEPTDTHAQLLSNVELAVKSGFEVSVFMPIFRPNVDDIIPTIEHLATIGIRDVQILRVSPVGAGEEMPDEMFLTPDEIAKTLRLVNSARHKVGETMKIALFGGYFGPNFYTKGIFKYLAGQKAHWPKSKYFCPMVGHDYIGVSAVSKDVYGCFFGLSIPEFRIGKYEEGKVTVTASLIEAESLSKSLQGVCGLASCEEQLVCLGGCRAIPYAWAKKHGENHPLTAGQDFCITRFLADMQK